MTRFSKVLGACALVLPMFSAVSKAQNANSAVAVQTSSPVSEGAIAITVISANAIAGTSAIHFARAQSRIADLRTHVHSASVWSGGGESLLPAPSTVGTTSSAKPSLGEVVLRGTNVGDAIRIEYVAATEASFTQAVTELKRGSEVWGLRAEDLRQDKALLTAKVVETRRLFTELPLDESSRGLRFQTLTELQALEKELTYVTRLHSDADLRMHGARQQYAAAERNLRVIQQTHQVKQRFNIVQDVYVDGRSTQLDSVFQRVIGDASSEAEAHRAVPHVRVVRIQMPNSTIVSKSLRNVRSGLLVAGLSAALILEEITVGAITESLANNAQTHFTPAIRTEAKAPSARRN